MSRTNPNQQGIPSPVTRYFEWKGSTAKFQHYDKASTTNVDAPDKFTFIVLDELNSMKGYNEQLEVGMYSNEVRNLKTQKMFVKSFKGPDVAEGFYHDIKDTVTSKGGKFCKSVYIAFKDETGELVIGNLQLVGSGFDGWVNFTKKHSTEMYVGGVQVVGKIAKKKGANNYFIPEFAIKSITKETDDKAGELQETLKTYLKDYFARAGQSNDVANDFEPPPETLFVNDQDSQEIRDEIASAPSTDDPDDLPF